jgi:DNA-binding protein HU-beta
VTIEREVFMTKIELMRRIATDANIAKKAAAAVLKAFVGAIHDSLKEKDGKIRVAELGTFSVSVRKARKGVNPRTQATITIPVMTVPRFSPAASLREVAKQANQ